jgi:hypothetical protein
MIMAGAPIVVFLGPTLDREVAASRLRAIYLPPAEQGAVVSAIGDFAPSAIALIDGAFAKVPAVRHKEILWALGEGVRVYGAASMGALRAAELAPFGMEGHGFIYRWYRSTVLADDDEVAVAMSPAELGARALSDALINMRLSFRRAERQGVLSRGLRNRLEDIARSIHFLDRTYAAVFERARAEAGHEAAATLDRAEAFVQAHAVDQKRADAVSLLDHLAGLPAAALRPPAARTAVRLTEAWLADLEEAGLSRAVLREP